MRKTRVSLFLMFAATTYATTILPITSGIADLTRGVNVDSGRESFLLNGPGFSFTGSGTNTAYACGPLILCIPGAEIPVGAADLVSEDRGISGTIRIGNTSYNYAINPGSSDAELHFLFDLTTPGTNPPPLLTLTAPFTSTALFEDLPFFGGETFEFEGQGRVIVNLMLQGPPITTQSVYMLQNMHFDFGVPEPGTATLSCLAAAVFGVFSLFKWGLSRYRRAAESRGQAA